MSRIDVLAIRKQAFVLVVLTTLLIITNPGSLSASWFVFSDDMPNSNRQDIISQNENTLSDHLDSYMQFNPEFSVPISIAGGAIIADPKAIDYSNITTKSLAKLDERLVNHLTIADIDNSSRALPSWNFYISGISSMKSAGYTGAGTRLGVIAGDYLPDHIALEKCIHETKMIGSHSSERATSDLHLVHPLGILAGYEPGRFIGVAPETEIYLALIRPDMFNSEGLLHAIEWQINRPEPPDAILFCLDFSGPIPVALERSLAALRNLGIIPIIAAGNNPDRISGMAAHPSCVTVGAIDRWKNRALFSGQGPAIFKKDKVSKPDFCCPGDAVSGPADKNKYKTGSGTLQAAAHFAGLFLLLREARPEVDPELLISALGRTAKDLEEPGFDFQTGHGLPDPIAAITLLDQPPQF